MRKKGRSKALAAAAEKAYWRADDARVVLAALAQSGLTVAAFCRKHELSHKRVLRWRGVLATQSSIAVDFLRVDVVEDKGANGGSGQDVEVVLGNGRRIAVRQGFDAALLAEVAQTVETWPC